jgi:hypothetical protein
VSRVSLPLTAVCEWNIYDLQGAASRLPFTSLSEVGATFEFVAVDRNTKNLPDGDKFQHWNSMPGEVLARTRHSSVHR